MSSACSTTLTRARGLRAFAAAGGAGFDAETGIAAASAYLDVFYDERLRGLGARQRQYLDAAAGLDPADRTRGRIAEQLGTSSRRLASTWQSLVGRHGLLRSAGREGRLAFALPGLDTYLRRSPR